MTSSQSGYDEMTTLEVPMSTTADRAAPLWARLREPGAHDVWRRLLQPLAGRIRELAPSASVDVMTGVRRVAPEVFPHEGMFEEGVESAEETLRLFARILELGADPAAADVPLTTQDILRSSVWRRVPLSTNSRTYRLAHQQVWRWLHALVLETDAPPDDRDTAVDLLTTMLMEMVDRAMSRAEEVYEAERESWLQGAALSRAAAVGEVLDASGPIADATSMSARLRYELGRHHVGLMVWADPSHPGDGATSDLTDVVTTIARGVGAYAHLSHPMGAHVVAGWIAPRRDADTVIDAGGIGPLPSGVSVAVGEPAAGVDGFRLTHDDARRARGVAMTTSGSGTVTRYRDVALAALCVEDPGHAARFVGRVLGRLADGDEATKHRARTLEIYLSTNRSRAATASALSVHPNTVSYRVRQAEEALGRSIDVEPTELAVALRLLPAVRGLLAARPRE